MTSRERVLATLSHQMPDRIPRDFKATPEVDQQVMAHFGLTDVEQIRDVFSCENLHWPFRCLSPGGAEEGTRSLPDGREIDQWGVIRKPKDYGGGLYMEFDVHPLAACSKPEEIAAHPWPDPNELDFSVLRDECARYPDEALSGPSWGVFETSWYIRGMEQFLIDLATDEQMAWAVIGRVEDYWREYNRRAYEEAGDGFQVFMSGDDFGHQSGLLISVETWKKFFAPGYREAYEEAHRHGLKTMMHCDGATRPLIPHFIDIGLDCLDPVQKGVPDMDPVELKREFGADLAFHGTIDVQQLLPWATPAEVRDEVKRHIEVLGPTGFFLGPSHMIQPGTPMENIIALYEAADEFGTT